MMALRKSVCLSVCVSLVQLTFLLFTREFHEINLYTFADIQLRNI